MQKNRGLGENYSYGPWSFAIRMIPKMLETAHKHAVNPRPVIVASDVHYWTKIEKDDIASPGILAELSDKEHCTEEAMTHRYHDTKLFNVLFYQDLQPRVFPPSALSHPGLSFSGLGSGVSAGKANTCDEARGTCVQYGRRNTGSWYTML
ncbi:uncharacterized protein EV420DRAFT_1023147 [Desarmillaria tabescens]|uniref:Uncharacterized protein n=1 Tax=Armillaria tabescens TaxID=1929756 RepID=A0AA39JKN7_ARMTA|nr:uncharacterized protein EV420DRAFT_1023147 [Desarmillaria tabescens]KAK0443700.1 hypothetical protein EV420DRAFT_1023147 [Desarmillaria tabescens]